MHLEFTTADRERFESRVYRIPGGCHVWLGTTDPDGYGRVHYNGQLIQAHRFAWILDGRDLEEGVLVLHNCPGGDWPACVNLEHLWSGDIAANNRDKALKGRGTKGQLPFGVHRAWRSHRFQARVRVHGTLRHLGTFGTPEEAHEVAKAARVALGEVAP